MSETHTPEAQEPQFSPQEIAQFDADDAECGGALGKMLSLFFLYTIAAMSIAATWTFISADG